MSWVASSLIATPPLSARIDFSTRGLDDLECPVNDGIVVLGRQKPCTALKRPRTPLDQGRGEPYIACAIEAESIAECVDRLGFAKDDVKYSGETLHSRRN